MTATRQDTTFRSSFSSSCSMFLLTLALFVVAATPSASVGSPSSPCLVSYGGVQYDLSSANNYSRDYVGYDYPSRLGPNTYYIQPCMNTLTNCVGAGNNPGPGCQKDTLGNYHSMGVLSTATVLPPVFDNTTFIIEYTGGQQGRKLSIAFVCNATVNGAIIGVVTEPVAATYLVYFATSAVCQGVTNSTATLQFPSSQECSSACYQLSEQCDVTCQCQSNTVTVSSEECSNVAGSFLSTITGFHFQGNVAATFTFENGNDLGNALASSCMEGFSNVCAYSSTLTMTTTKSTSSFLPSSLTGLTSVQFASPY
eukprot:TRINITY_DN7440_c0_g1_i1.p1 TRINITY_DN7440_c0_g1~~TRINITY_DN7440_c0_g1_i1.p1  ORF type:complete len:311 (+),score=37.80 TRINITY_DN7440_c0_g1_i1:90-1022(+)